ncbi:MAG: hypothetical protein WD645_04205 [Dehalococcoidia bacterium]
MSYKNGDRVSVQLQGLESISARLAAEAGTVTGRILQRCGPEAYDVSLDKPLSPEVTFLSWVPERLLKPVN